MSKQATSQLEIEPTVDCMQNGWFEMPSKDYSKIDQYCELGQRCMGRIGLHVASRHRICDVWQWHALRGGRWVVAVVGCSLFAAGVNHYVSEFEDCIH